MPAAWFEAKARSGAVVGAERGQPALLYAALALLKCGDVGHALGATAEVGRVVPAAVAAGGGLVSPLFGALRSGMGAITLHAPGGVGAISGSVPELLAPVALGAVLEVVTQVLPEVYFAVANMPHG